MSAARHFSKVCPPLKGPEVHHDPSGKHHRHDVLSTNRFYIEKQIFCLDWLDLCVHIRPACVISAVLIRVGFSQMLDFYRLSSGNPLTASFPPAHTVHHGCKCSQTSDDIMRCSTVDQDYSKWASHELGLTCKGEGVGSFKESPADLCWCLLNSLDVLRCCRRVSAAVCISVALLLRMRSSG